MNKHFSNELFDDIERTSEMGDNYFTPVIDQLKNHLTSGNRKILDVGCGTGLFFCSLSKLPKTELYGLDAFSSSSEIAVNRGYKKVVNIDDLNECLFPFADNEFDAVMCKDVFEHLLLPLAALKEIKRVLKPGGLLLIHVPNHFSFYGRVKFLIFNKIDTFKYFGNDDRWTYPHVRFFEHSGFEKKLVDFGFITVDDYSDFFPAIPLLSRFKILQFAFRSLLKCFPGQMCGSITLLVENGK